MSISRKSRRQMEEAGRRARIEYEEWADALMCELCDRLDMPRSVLKEPPPISAQTESGNAESE